MLDPESHELAVDVRVTLTPDWRPNVAWELKVNGHVELFSASPVEGFSSENLRGDEDVLCFLLDVGCWYVPGTLSTHNAARVNSECSEGVSAHGRPVFAVAHNSEINPIIDFRTTDWVEGSDACLDGEVCWHGGCDVFWVSVEHVVRVQVPLLVESESDTHRCLEVEGDAAWLFSDLNPLCLIPWILVLNDTLNIAVIVANNLLEEDRVRVSTSGSNF
jgi:hypothetical protein